MDGMKKSNEVVGMVQPVRDTSTPFINASSGGPSSREQKNDVRPLCIRNLRSSRSSRDGVGYSEHPSDIGVRSACPGGLARCS